MIRLGLCCQFVGVPVKFRTTTLRHIRSLGRSEGISKLSRLCLENALSLQQAIKYCAGNGIGAFRINSQIWPLKTAPDAAYALSDLPDAERIAGVLSACRREATIAGVRLSFHPDQFVLLSSPSADVVRKSVEELEYQDEVAELTGADVINIHAGGAYGDKPSALKRMIGVLADLKPSLCSRLTLENDDTIYTPRDLMDFCMEQQIPLVYDAHHHRCLPDGLSVAEVTGLARRTWNREPLFHVSSPRDGWASADPRPHHDYIDSADFPPEWLGFDLTVDVEAKAKERAVLKLKGDLENKDSLG